ncbi:glutamate 5-kinase [Devriesea agamarum]|uniref:glutamate 5-kinase n=1 Tax=Devriesea agamarum TaxID=472569 RepID=UPI00071D0580|nr:glutamate 5-kinase [Devriesea agamarum]
MTPPARVPAKLTTREGIADAQRIVIKVGSSSLTTADGHLDRARINDLVDVIARTHRDGREIVLVTSGAIAAALDILGLDRRPSDVIAQQAAASVGQGLLIAAYTQAFAVHGLHVGQVLLTESDVVQRETYRNARACLGALLTAGIVPIVNENDAVATAEIRFGDNDRLAALVAQAIGADLLVVLTDVDGLYTAPPGSPGAHKIDCVENFDDLRELSIGSVGSAVGTGGMVTKLDAAHIAVTTGTAVVLTHAGLLSPALSGEQMGTFFPAHPGRRRTRLVWLRCATRGAGQLIVDEGAVQALVSRRCSLLAVGIVRVDGAFGAGAPVDICDTSQRLIARGLVAHSSDDIREMAGLRAEVLRMSKGERFVRAVVHRDDLVLLGGAASRRHSD